MEFGIAEALAGEIHHGCSVNFIKDKSKGRQVQLFDISFSEKKHLVSTIQYNWVKQKLRLGKPLRGCSVDFYIKRNKSGNSRKIQFSKCEYNANIKGA